MQLSAFKYRSKDLTELNLKQVFKTNFMMNDASLQNKDITAALFRPTKNKHKFALQLYETKRYFAMFSVCCFHYHH